MFMNRNCLIIHKSITYKYNRLLISHEMLFSFFFLSYISLSNKRGLQIVITPQNLPFKFHIGRWLVRASSRDKVYNEKKLTFNGCLWFRWFRVLLRRTGRSVFQIHSELRVILALGVITQSDVIITGLLI